MSVFLSECLGCIRMYQAQQVRLKDTCEPRDWLRYPSFYDDYLMEDRVFLFIFSACLSVVIDYAEPTFLTGTSVHLF